MKNVEAFEYELFKVELWEATVTRSRINIHPKSYDSINEYQEKFAPVLMRETCEAIRANYERAIGTICQYYLHLS
jgi:hypothetical protein